LKKFGRNFLDFLKCKSANVRMKLDLLEYGPQFPDKYDQSDFSFRALVNTNWSMAVEYELERQGTVVINIEVMGAPTFTQRLDGEGIGKRQSARFTLPVYPGKGLHPALITLKAIRPGRYGDERADFVFHGAGAGEVAVVSRPREPPGVEVAVLGRLPPGVGRNVGSLAGRDFGSSLSLYDVTFRPGWGGGYYVFSFKVNGRFSRWGADITRMIPRRGRRMSSRVVNVALREFPIGPEKPVRGDWNGLGMHDRKVLPGEYSVFAMAWVAAENRGNWNASQSSESLAIK
jgi:hypothetical protein